MPTIVSLLVVVAVTTVLDQAVKGLVCRRPHRRECRIGGSGIGIRLVHNRRAGVFGRGHSPSVVVGAVIVWSALAVGAAVLAASPAGGGAVTLGLGLAVGGAAGNLCDRIRRGAVVDFIVLWRWPVFNLADSAMVLGAGIVAWAVL